MEAGSLVNLLLEIDLFHALFIEFFLAFSFACSTVIYGIL